MLQLPEFACYDIANIFDRETELRQIASAECVVRVRRAEE